MKQNRLFFILIVQTMITCILTALFVILFYRIYPNKFLLLFPSAIALSLLISLLSYLPFKSFIEK